MKQQLIHMHDQKANQTAMSITTSKEAAIEAIEQLILLLAVACR
jgi:hypothetical protein